MNFDDIQATWRSTRNQPSTDQLSQLKMNLASDLRKRRRKFFAFGLITFLLLALPTGALIQHLLGGPSGANGIDFGREWASLASLALPWIAWVIFMRRFQRHLSAHKDYDHSIQESVRALLDDNAMSRARLKLVGGLQVVMILLLPLIIYQLKSVGKAGDEINILYVLVPVGFGAIMMGMLFHDRCTLLPHKRSLDALLESYR